MDFKPATFRRGTILSCNRNEENALMVDANDFGSLYGEDEEIPNRCDYFLYKTLKRREENEDH